MKIAVVHDNFAQLGGAERVAEEIFEMFPQASLFAAVALRECMPSRLQRRAGANFMDAEAAKNQRLFQIVLSPLSTGHGSFASFRIRSCPVELLCLRQRSAGAGRCHTRMLLPHSRALDLEL